MFFADGFANFSSTDITAHGAPSCKYIGLWQQAIQLSPPVQLNKIEARIFPSIFLGSTLLPAPACGQSWMGDHSHRPRQFPGPSSLQLSIDSGPELTAFSASSAPPMQGSRSTSSMATIQNLQARSISRTGLSHPSTMVYNSHGLPPLPALPSVYPSSQSDMHAGGLSAYNGRSFAGSRGMSSSTFDGTGLSRLDGLPPSSLTPSLAGTGPNLTSTRHARSTFASGMPSSAGSGTSGAAGSSTNFSRSEEDALYVSPKLIMTGPSSSSHPTRRSGSRRASGSPPSTLAASTFSSAAMQRHSSDSRPQSQPQRPLTGTSSSTGMLSTSSSPLIGRNPDATLSVGLVFDPDWELPSPLVSTPLSGTGRQLSPSSLSRRGSLSDLRGRGSHDASFGQSGMPPLSSGSGHDTASSALDSGYSTQSRASPFTYDTQPTALSMSSFRYDGYEPGMTPFSSSAGTLLGTSSLGYSNSVRPSSQGLMGPMSSLPPLPQSFSGSQLNSASMQPSLSAGSRSISNSRISTGSRSRPSTRGQGLSAFSAGLPSTTANPSLSIYNNLPLPDLAEDRNLSPRRRRSFSNLHSSSDPSRYTPTTASTGELHLPLGYDHRPYRTRTRQNMQGLMHSDHVDQGFPGEWGGAFR